MNIATFRQLLPLLLIIFIDSMGYFIAIPVLVRVLNPDTLLLASDVSATTRNILFSVALAIMPLAAIISRPIMGYCSDRFGRKKVLSHCLVGSACGFLLPVWGIAIGSFSLIVIGRFISGITASSQAIAQAAIADITAGKSKAFYLSLNALCMTFAMAGGSVLGGVLSDPSLVSWFNDGTPFLAATGLVFIAYILLQKFYLEYNNEPTIKMQFWATFHKIILSSSAKNTRLLLCIFFLLELSWSLYYQAAPLTLNEYYGIDATTIGLFMGYAGLWMCIGLGVVYGGLLRFFTLPHVLLTCMFLCTLGTLICGYLPSFSGQWYNVIPIVLGVGMTYPTLLTLMSNNTDPAQQGGLMGLAGATLALAWLLTGLSAGFLVNLFPALPMHASGWIMLLGFILTWRWYRAAK
jgi:MFS family permease